MKIADIKAVAALAERRDDVARVYRKIAETDEENFRRKELGYTTREFVRVLGMTEEGFGLLVRSRMLDVLDEEGRSLTEQIRGLGGEE